VQLKNVLLAGPWVGEFGWELFCWQGYIRSLSKNFDRTIIVSSQYSKFLYEDFCDQFIAFDPTGGSYKDSFYKVGLDIGKETWKGFLDECGYDKSKEKLTVFKPRRIGDPPRTHFSQSFAFGEYAVKPEYIKLGTKDESYKNTVVIHARNRSLRPNDNWSENKWKKLVDKIDKTCYNIICIGLKKEAMHIKGTVDKRECDQQELLNILHNSICVFGPSSGAMHLASLCGCPQIVWTTDYNLDRYTKNWNPFETDVVFLSDQGWQPTAEYVYDNFIGFVNDKD